MDDTMRIGEVARRTGVSVETLRAWERRYGVLDPDRSDGGHRRYTEADVARVVAVQDLVDRGWSAGSASRRVLLEASAPPLNNDAFTGAEALVRRMRDAIERFDARAVEEAIDDTLLRFEPLTALDEVLVPVLRWVGDGWQQDARVIAREHFASNVLRSRLTRLLRTTPSVVGRSAVAFAPGDEGHDLGLLMASVALSSVGWRVHFLGARTPKEAVERAVSELKPSVVVVAAVDRAPAATFLQDPPALPEDVLVLLGGPGFLEGDEATFSRAVRHTGRFRDVPDVVDPGREAA